MKKTFLYIRHHYQEINKGLLFILAVVILVYFFPKEGKFRYEFSQGKPWLHETLIAPFDFPIYKTDSEIATEQQLLVENLKPYFRFDESVEKQVLENLPAAFSREWQNRFDEELQGDPADYVGYQVAKKIIDTLFRIGIIELDPVIEAQTGTSKIMLVRSSIAEEVELQSLYTINAAYSFLRTKLDNYPDINTSIVLALFENVIIQNVSYDHALTEAEKEKVLAGVSLTRGMVQQGERIISKGELVTHDKFQVLESLKREYETQLGSSSSLWMIIAGQAVLVAIALVVMFVFIYFYRRNLFFENRRLLLILLVIVLMVVTTSLIVNYYPAYLFLIPICLVPIVIRAFFDSILALFVHIITVIIIGFLVPNSFEFIFLELIAGIITIISIVNLQRRSQFFLTSLLIFLTYAVIYVGLSLIHEGSLEHIDSTHFMLFAGGALLTLLSYPLIYLLEKTFGYVTDVTLMELSDTNRKLLRELSSKAPGTFQHSLQVANIAEEVTRAIGGNALLVRAGALYHDVGKMDMPLYFIENQSTGINPHDELSGEESARIILSHVIKGVEMARKYKLPESLIDFIRTHHGTRKVEYFYTKYLESDPDEPVDPELFTYRGPIPFSKETAVLMMSDSVEAASRSVQQPDEQKLSNLVDKIIDAQLRDGQFENADLSMKEITTTRKILKRKLMNIYHIRIAYPE
jgi:putative nucleotidyltransferase with HDIG domain